MLFLKCQAFTAVYPCRKLYTIHNVYYTYARLKTPQLILWIKKWKPLEFSFGLICKKENPKFVDWIS